MTLHVTQGPGGLPAGAAQRISDVAGELHIPLLVALVPTEDPCKCGNADCDGRKPALVVRIVENHISQEVAAGVLAQVVESVRIAASVGRSKN